MQGNRTLKRGFGFVGTLAWLVLSQTSQAQIWADLVLYNGKIPTANTDNPENFATEQAVAIYDGKFVAVGSSQQVLTTAGPQTVRIDLEGRGVIPGRIDTCEQAEKQGYVIRSSNQRLTIDHLTMVRSEDIRRFKSWELFPASLPGSFL